MLCMKVYYKNTVHQNKREKKKQKKPNNKQKTEEEKNQFALFYYVGSVLCSLKLFYVGFVLQKNMRYEKIDEDEGKVDAEKEYIYIENKEELREVRIKNTEYVFISIRTQEDPQTRFKNI